MSVRLIAKSIWSNPGNRGQRLRRSAMALLWQVTKRVAPKPKIIRLTNGRQFIAHPDCVISSALIYSEWPEFHEFTFIRAQLQQDDVLIDVGANVGHVGLLLSDIVRPADIVAFEPTPVTFARLEQNWKLNGQELPKLYPHAVGDVENDVLIPNPTSPITVNKPIHDECEKSADLVAVRLMPLDAFRHHWSERKIGLVKIDVEGFEAGVFAGAADTLHFDRPRLIMFESLAGGVDPKIDEVLKEARYEVFQLNESGQPVFDRCDSQNLFAIPSERRAEFHP
ncbi:MAG: FkbM family methyltransferase [Planctomycetota bacterium]